MRGLHLRVVRQLARAYGRRYLSTENDIYKAGTGPPPSIVGSVICAMLEGGITYEHLESAMNLQTSCWETNAVLLSPHVHALQSMPAVLQVCSLALLQYNPACTTPLKFRHAARQPAASLCSAIFVVAVSFSGKGRGIIARHSVAAGDLLMCLRPAVVIEGLSDTSLDPALLVPNLIQAANAEDVPDIAAALKCLYNGTGESLTSNSAAASWQSRVVVVRAAACYSSAWYSSA